MDRHWALAVAMCVVVAGAVVLVASGCSSAQPELAGTSWTLSAWAESSPPPASVTITAAFDASQVSGNSGVNSYFGSYERDDDGAFSVGQLGGTMMAGTEEAMRAEQTYLRLLEAARLYAVADGTLVLKDADGNDSLTFAASE